MNIGYIKKEVLPYRIIDKVKYFLGIVIDNKFEHGYVFRLPIFDKEKKEDRVIQNLLKQIRKTKVDTIVFSEDVIKGSIYFKIKQEFDKYNINVLNGRKLMKYMDYDIFEYILNLQKADIKQEDIFFLIKKDKDLDLQFLARFVEKCKTVNIVTNDLERFKAVQNSLYENEKILISVSNNKSKSLKRAKYIFNINMNKKDLEKFKINRNAIIVNFGEFIQYDSNVFDGINVNYFQIGLPDEYIEAFEDINECEEFEKIKLYESVLIKKIETEGKKTTTISKRRNIAQDRIKKDGIKITGLIGNNGRINEREIIQNYQKVI